MATIVTHVVQEQGGEAFPAEVWGLGALGILIGLLVVTLMFGRGRPHV